MPWRVGRDFRHLSQAAHSFLERSRTLIHPLCVIAKPIHSTRGILWPPALALKLNYSHAPIVESENSLPESFVQSDAGDQVPEPLVPRESSKKDAGGSEVVPLTPPRDILSTLEDLFARYPWQCTLEDVRRHQPNSDLVSYLRSPRGHSTTVYLLDAGYPDHAFWVWSLATAIGASCPPKVYNVLARRFAELEKWKLVRRLTNLARLRMGYTTTKLLNWRLRALTEMQHYVPVDKVLALFAKEHVTPDRMTYHLLISMHLHNHDLAAALTSLRIMESAGFAVTAKTCAIIVRGHRSFGLTPAVKEQALATLETAKDGISRVILNGLVQLLVDAEDLHAVAETLSSVSQTIGDHSSRRGDDTILRDDAATTTSRKVDYSSSSHSTRRRDIITVTTYNILLYHFARRGDVPRAMHVLSQMNVAQVFPDSGTAAALVRLYFVAGYPNDALHVVAGVLGDIPEAIALLPTLGFITTISSKHPIPPPTPPTVYLFNALIWGILSKRGLLGGHTVLSMMQITKITPNERTISMLLSYMRRHRSCSPRQLIRFIRGLKSPSITPTIQHLHVLLGSVVAEERAKAHPRGWRISLPATTIDPPELVEEPAGTPAKHLQPIAGITPVYPLKYHKLLKPVLQSMDTRGLRADRAVYALQIKHLALVRRDMEAAAEKFRDMVDAGFTANKYHYGALMEGYAAAGKLLAAADVMRSASEAGVRPNVRTHTILIAGYARLGQRRKAVEAFRNMLAEGIRPDVPAIDALVSAFFRVKAYSAARRVLLRMWPQVGPIPDNVVDAPLRTMIKAFRELHPSNKRRYERASNGELRMLKKKLRDMLQPWKRVVSKGKEKESVESTGDAHDVPSRQPQYTRAPLY